LVIVFVGNINSKFSNIHSTC